MTRVLITGGAGYVGSHIAVSLKEQRHDVFVIDDLSHGHRDAVCDGIEFMEGDVTASGMLRSAVLDWRAQAIIHCAARIDVAESMAVPERYYETNVVGMVRVAEVASSEKLPVVFSSTAAVYGRAKSVPIPIEHPCQPENAYGHSKLMSERILAECGSASRFSYAILRYFNAAGADSRHGLRERHSPETHLIPRAIAAAQTGEPLVMFGDDWETKDGTCIRDYVHVMDLADAHALALRKVETGTSFTVNLGAGQGATVREVLAAVSAVVGRSVPVRVAGRRPGDVEALVADIAAARNLLNWSPKRSTLERIATDAFEASAV